MKRVAICLALFPLFAWAADERPAVTDGEVWNEGVEYYR